MTIHHIPDDEKGITPVFELLPVHNEAKSKLAGRPIFDDVEHVRIYIAGFSKEKQPVFPAHEIWRWQDKVTNWGTVEKSPITYAERFSRQYMEFKGGGKQTLSGTPLSEAPFLTNAQRSELRGIQIHNVETLSTIDGSSLKMLGPGGRDLKNQAIAYLEKAAKGVTSNEMADALSKSEAKIEALQRQIDSMISQTGAFNYETGKTEVDGSRETIEVSPSTVAAFETFTDEDLKAWLTDGGIKIDGRWGRNKMIEAAEEHLIKTGKAKKAA